MTFDAPFANTTRHGRDPPSTAGAWPDPHGRRVLAPRASRRTPRVAELNRPGHRVLAEEVPPETAFGVSDDRCRLGEGPHQGDMGSRQQRGFADLAAELKHETGVQSLPTSCGRAPMSPPHFEMRTLTPVQARWLMSLCNESRSVNPSSTTIPAEDSRTSRASPARSSAAIGCSKDSIPASATRRSTPGPARPPTPCWRRPEGPPDGPGESPRLLAASTAPSCSSLTLTCRKPKCPELEQRDHVAPSPPGRHHAAVPRLPQRRGGGCLLVADSRSSGVSNDTGWRLAWPKASISARSTLHHAETGERQAESIPPAPFRRTSRGTS